MSQRSSNPGYPLKLAFGTKGERDVEAKPDARGWGLTGLLRVEGFLEGWQQIGLTSSGGRVRDEMGIFRQPWVLKGFCGGRSLARVDGEASADEVASRCRDRCPILFGFKLVISANDGFHLLLLIVPVEGGVTTQEEVGDDAHGPDVHRFVMASLK